MRSCSSRCSPTRRVPTTRGSPKSLEASKAAKSSAPRAVSSRPIPPSGPCTTRLSGSRNEPASGRT